MELTEVDQWPQSQARAVDAQEEEAAQVRHLGRAVGPAPACLRTLLMVPGLVSAALGARDRGARVRGQLHRPRPHWPQPSAAAPP